MIDKGLFGLCILLIVFCFVSCGYNEFDSEYESDDIPTSDSTQQISISRLKSLYVEGGVTILTDAIIRGTITANDIADNFYKKIIIQDSTGAIAIALGLYDLHNIYPIGSSVSVRVRGLRLGIEDGLYKLGLASENSSSEVDEIPTRDIMNKYLSSVKQTTSISVPVRKISELKDSDVGTLVKIENITADLSIWQRWAQSEKYSSSGYARSMDIPAVDSSFSTIYIFTSGYASFADELIPLEDFSVTGIVVKRNSSEFRIRLRTLSDIETNNI